MTRLFPKPCFAVCFLLAASDNGSVCEDSRVSFFAFAAELFADALLAADDEFLLDLIVSAIAVKFFT